MIRFYPDRHLGLGYELNEEAGELCRMTALDHGLDVYTEMEQRAERTVNLLFIVGMIDPRPNHRLFPYGPFMCPLADTDWCDECNVDLMAEGMRFADPEFARRQRALRRRTRRGRR